MECIVFRELTLNALGSQPGSVTYFLSGGKSLMPLTFSIFICNVKHIGLLFGGRLNEILCISNMCNMPGNTALRISAFFFSYKSDLWEKIIFIRLIQFMLIVGNI